MRLLKLRRCNIECSLPGLVAKRTVGAGIEQCFNDLGAAVVCGRHQWCVPLRVAYVDFLAPCEGLLDNTAIA